jgi:hypothetical protein
MVTNLGYHGSYIFMPLTYRFNSFLMFPSLLYEISLFKSTQLCTLISCFLLILISIVWGREYGVVKYIAYYYIIYIYIYIYIIYIYIYNINIKRKIIKNKK